MALPTPPSFVPHEQLFVPVLGGILELNSWQIGQLRQLYRNPQPLHDIENEREGDCNHRLQQWSPACLGADMRHQLSLSPTRSVKSTLAFDSDHVMRCVVWPYPSLQCDNQTQDNAQSRFNLLNETNKNDKDDKDDRNSRSISPATASDAHAKSSRHYSSSFASPVVLVPRSEPALQFHEVYVGGILGMIRAIPDMCDKRQNDSAIDCADADATDTDAIEQVLSHTFRGHLAAYEDRQPVPYSIDERREWYNMQREMYLSKSSATPLNEASVTNHDATHGAERAAGSEVESNTKIETSRSCQRGNILVPTATRRSTRLFMKERLAKDSSASEPLSPSLLPANAFGERATTQQYVKRRPATFDSLPAWHPDVQSPQFHMETYGYSIMHRLCTFDPTLVTRSQELGLAQYFGSCQIYNIWENVGEPIPDSPFPISLVSSIGLDVARSLHFAHSQGIVHNDLKVENVVLSWSDRVRRKWCGGVDLDAAVQEGRKPKAILIDFELSGVFECGSRILWPPEFSTEMSESQCNPSRDMWSFGVMLFELFCVRKPKVVTQVHEFICDMESTTRLLLRQSSAAIHGVYDDDNESARTVTSESEFTHSSHRSANAFRKIFVERNRASADAVVHQCDQALDDPMNESDPDSDDDKTDGNHGVRINTHVFHGVAFNTSDHAKPRHESGSSFSESIACSDVHVECLEEGPLQDILSSALHDTRRGSVWEYFQTMILSGPKLQHRATQYYVSPENVSFDCRAGISPKSVSHENIERRAECIRQKRALTALSDRDVGELVMCGASRGMIELIASCLALDPRDRWNAVQAEHRLEEILKSF